MTRVNTILFCGLLFIGKTIATLECGPNESEIECASPCATDYCPKSAGPYEPCPQPTTCPQPICKCGFNYRRADNGTCIPTTDCPAFECSGQNEVYTPCPPICTDDCNQITRYGECSRIFGFILIVLECTPTCRCSPGYGRNNGSCIKFTKCPKT